MSNFERSEISIKQHGELQSLSQQEFQKVTKILSPDSIVLSSSGQVQLFGIRTNREKADEAMEFLRRITEGQRVFLKQDKVKTDGAGTPMVYLYLESGAFLNALLVKYQLTDVEDSIPFRCLPRFLKKEADNRSSGSAMSGKL